MLTYEKAKENIQFLQEYILLIESFEINNIQDLIIHQYAKLNSISKVIKSIKMGEVVTNFRINNDIITHEFVRDIILSKPKAPLHAYIQKEYKIKTRPQRRRSRTKS